MEPQKYLTIAYMANNLSLMQLPSLRKMKLGEFERCLNKINGNEFIQILEDHGSIARDSTTAQEGQNKILRAKLLATSRKNSQKELYDCLLGLFLLSSNRLRDYEVPIAPRR